MGEVIQFIPKAERERLRLIREARAIYDSVFPPADLRQQSSPTTHQSSFNGTWIHQGGEPLS